MAFPQQFLDELVSRNDIYDVVSSYVNLTRRGGNYFGLCPFHNEKTGSFSVSTDKQIYHCFGCKHGGGVINFIMEIENLSFPDAVRFLAKRVNMEVPEDNADRDAARRRQRLLAANRDAARWFYQNLGTPAGAKAAAYLERRRISRRTAMNFGLGAAPDSWDGLLNAMLAKGYTKAELIAAGLVGSSQNGRVYDFFRDRLMLPIIDVRGDIVGFTGRTLCDDVAKYKNSNENVLFSKKRSIFGINLAKKTKRPNIILCEGNIDVVTLHQAGFDNAVACMGTAFTVEHARILSRYTKELVLCFDNDSAGVMATQRAISQLEASELKVRVLQLPKQLGDQGEMVKQDPDDFIKNHGPEAFEALLSGSQNQMDFRMGAVAAKYDLSQSEQKIAYGAEVTALIASIPNAVEREVYAGRAAELAGLSKSAMLMDVDKALKKRRGQERRALQKENLNVAALHQPKERSLRYDDVRSAMAEEGVIRLLFLDDTLVSQCAALGQEDFSSPLLGRIYAALLEANAQGRVPSVSSLAGELTREETAHLTALLQKPESLAGAERSLPDYIHIIQESAGKRRGGAQLDPLLAAQEKYKDKKKGYGGKRNG